MFTKAIPLALIGILAVAVNPSAAREYYIGGPVQQNDMEIVANYLVGVEMSPMSGDMAHGPDVIHLEADVHATADNVYGFPDGAWIPGLAITYSLAKIDTDWRLSGSLLPMLAKDGPHYANNIKMNGPGKYKLTYRFSSPESTGFLRHVDRETGVPEWWSAFSESFTFSYPQK